MELVLPSDLTPFLAYFRAFKKVRDAAFTSYPHQYDRNCPASIEEVLKPEAKSQSKAKSHRLVPIDYKSSL